MNTKETPVVLIQRADLDALVKDPELHAALLEAGISAPGFEWGNTLEGPAILIQAQQRGG